MAKAKISHGYTVINCPACKTTHHLNTDPNNKPCWGFNGDFDRPTFTPSILERSGHFVGNRSAQDCIYCNDPEYKDCESPTCYLCHSFVTDGNIQFLSDCSHELAGKTVPLEDI